MLASIPLLSRLLQNVDDITHPGMTSADITDLPSESSETVHDIPICVIALVVTYY